MEDTQNTYTILIAEDERDLREAIQTALEQLGGFTVIAVSNGNSAITEALTHKPDMVLLDLNLPERNGVDIITEIRSSEWGAHVPISLLTVERDMARVSDAMEAGGPNTGYLTKNDWTLEKVVEHVKEKVGV